MIVVSNWTVIHDPAGAAPFTLLAAGDDMEDEVAFPWRQTTQSSRPLGGGAARQFGRGNMETTLKLTVYKTHASHAAARAWLLAWTAAVPKHSADLSIAVSGGATYLLSSAVICGGDGRMTTSGPPRTVVSYDITGGILTVQPA